jgi:hypothetical protein
MTEWWDDFTSNKYQCLCLDQQSTQVSCMLRSMLLTQSMETSTGLIKLASTSICSTWLLRQSIGNSTLLQHTIF